MKKFKKLDAGIMALTMVMGLLTGCGSKSTLAADTTTASETKNVAETKSEKESSADELVVRVANFNFSIWNSQFIVAYQSGILDEVFASDNVKFEISEFANGPAVNEAFIAGEVDIVNGIGDQPIIAAAANNIDTKVLSQTAKQEKNIGIIAKTDSGIEKPEDLKGKRVGVYIGTYVHKSLIGILGDYGISSDDVEIVNITSTSDADAAFSTGDIDAYLSMNADHINKNVASGDFIEVTDLTGHPAYSYIVASNDFITKYPEVTQKFIDALAKAQELIDADRSKAYEYIAEFSGFELDYVKGTLDEAGIEFNLSDESVENLKTTYNFMHDYEMITKELTDDQIAAHIDRTFIDNVSK